MVIFMIEKAGMDVNARDKSGWTPLHVACSKGSLEIIEFLLNNNLYEGTRRAGIYF